MSPRVPVSLVVLAVSVALIIYGLGRYRRESTKPELIAFVALMSAISLTQIGVIMADTVTQPGRQLFWVNFVNAITLPFAVYTLLWFALAYSGNGRWIRWTVAVAVGHITVSAVAVALSPEFFFEVTGQSTSGPVTMIGITVEEWVFLDRNSKLPFVLFQLTSYAIVLVSGIVLTRYIVNNRARLYAGQILTLGIGMVTPIVLNSLVLVGTVSLTINYTTMSLGVTSVAFAVAIFRYRLFRLAPIGRQQLIDTMDDPVLMVDTDNSVVDCNRTARYLVDSPQAWRGVSITEFFAPFPSDFTRPEDFSDEQIRYTQNGQTQYFDPRIAPIHTQRTGLAGYLIVLREVTTLHEQKQRVKDQNEQLGQFTAMVSHDLRNPLTVAEGRLELAQAECDSPHLDDAADALERSQDLVEDLLALARSDDTAGPTETVSLPELVEDCWQVIPSEDATLRIDTERTISADSDRVRQLLENLFRNAVEHGGNDVTVTVGEMSGGFYIADDGVGFSTDDREEMFTAEYSTVEDGLGIGLQIVQQIVNAHNWEIRATDSADGGARFEITGVEIVE